MILTFMELVDLVIMTVGLGFIFSDFIIQAFHHANILLDKYSKVLGYSALVIAPGIALHEMGHKFVALSMGLPAVFHASYWGLTIGIILKLMAFPFLFFVPGFVSHAGGTPLQSSAIAFAGPGVNLLIWAGCAAYLKWGTFKKRDHTLRVILMLTSKINLFLFAFNMIPIPPFDGFTVFYGLFKAFF